MLHLKIKHRETVVLKGGWCLKSRNRLMKMGSKKRF